MRVVFSIVRFDSQLVPSIGVGVRLHVSVALKFLDRPDVQMVQVRTVSHRLHRRVEPDVVTSVERADGLADQGELVLGNTQADVGAVDSNPVVLVHLDEDVG